MSKGHRKLEECPNCNTKLESDFEYCPKCGQVNHDIKIPISHLGYEFVEGFTHFDTKLWNTLKSFFTSPGLITKEFLEGKRAKYVPPPRYYIFISVIFFLLLGKLANKIVEHDIVEKQKTTEKVNIKCDNVIYEMKEGEWMEWLASDTLKSDSILVITKNPMAQNYKRLRDSVYVGLKQYHLNMPKKNKNEFHFSTSQKKKRDVGFKIDSITNDKTEDQESDNVQSYLKQIDSLYYKRSPSLLKEYSYQSKSNSIVSGFSLRDMEFLKTASDAQIDSMLVKKEIIDDVNSNYNFLMRGFFKRIDKYYNLDLANLVPVILKAYSFCMFILMPLVAFLTWLFFRKERKYYVEHLVFSIHSHSFLFTIYSLLLIFYMITHISITWLIFILIFGIWIYLYLSVKRVFNESSSKTLFKFLIVNFIYFIIANVFSIISFWYGFVNF